MEMKKKNYYKQAFEYTKNIDLSKIDFSKADLSKIGCSVADISYIAEDIVSYEPSEDYTFDNIDE